MDNCFIAHPSFSTYLLAKDCILTLTELNTWIVGGIVYKLDCFVIHRVLSSLDVWRLQTGLTKITIFRF